MTTTAMNPAAPRRTVLITGAGSGLGRGMSLFLANEGHSILVTDKDLGAARETVARVTEAGGAAEAFALDVTSEEDIARFLGEIGERPVEVLLNNAGLQYVASVEEYPTDRWDLLMDVMVKGTFLMTRAVLPRMRAGGYGRIIQTGSIHSLIASPFKAPYTAAKHALVGFSKSVALETADTDITVNTINPAYIRTPLVEGQIAGLARSRGISEEEVVSRVMLEPMPKKAFITIEEVAGAVSYLMSPLARNITGQTITIDGGWTAQ